MVWDVSTVKAVNAGITGTDNVAPGVRGGERCTAVTGVAGPPAPRHAVSPVGLPSPLSPGSALAGHPRPAADDFAFSDKGAREWQVANARW